MFAPLHTDTQSKGKDILVTHHEGVEAQRYPAWTSAIGECWWSMPGPGRFTPEEGSPVPIVQEAGLAPRPV